MTWDRALLVLGLAAAIWFGLDQHWADDKIIAALPQKFESSQDALNMSQAETAAVGSISLDTFLRQYNAHAATLKSAAEAYEAAKAAKGSTIVGSDAAGALAVARNELYAATDNFTDFVDRWRSAAETFNKMLDGNVTRLENSRREDNADDVGDAARRIVSSAPDLATPLRVALDRLRPAPPDKK